MDPQKIHPQKKLLLRQQRILLKKLNILAKSGESIEMFTQISWQLLRIQTMLMKEFAFQFLGDDFSDMKRFIGEDFEVKGKRKIWEGNGGK
jgi:hypothetical protein